MEDQLVSTFSTSRDDGSVVIVNEWQGYHRQGSTAWGERGDKWVPDARTTFRTDAGIPVTRYGRAEGFFWIPSTFEKLTRSIAAHVAPTVLNSSRSVSMSTGLM